MLIPGQGYLNQLWTLVCGSKSVFVYTGFAKARLICLFYLRESMVCVMSISPIKDSRNIVIYHAALYFIISGIHSLVVDVFIFFFVLHRRCYPFGGIMRLLECE